MNNIKKTKNIRIYPVTATYNIRIDNFAMCVNIRTQICFAIFAFPIQKKLRFFGFDLFQKSAQSAEIIIENVIVSVKKAFMIL